MLKRIQTIWVICGILLLCTGCPPPVEEFVEPPPPPEQIEEPPGLKGTSWEWQGVGTKLEFKSETRITMNGTQNYAYTYDKKERTGTAGILGAFSVDAEFRKLTFADFMGAGVTVFDNRAGAIINSSWVWGQSALRFGTEKVSINGVQYGYTFDPETSRGSIDKIGAFEIAEDTVTIRNWRRSSFDVIFAKGTDPAPQNGSLIGSAWGWENPFNGWIVLEFMTDSDAITTFTASSYHDDTPFEHTYTYSDTEKQGVLVTQGNTFNISASNKTISFVQWQSYPHGADFRRIE